MRAIFSNTNTFNNPFNKSLRNNNKGESIIPQSGLNILQKDTVSFGHYYSAGRGEKPALYRYVEQRLNKGEKPEYFLNFVKRLKELALSSNLQKADKCKTMVNKIEPAVNYELDMHMRPKHFPF